ncbi:aminotransferase class III-fold pyridoxal phosphate-dependent enzyme [Thalassobaculum sp.]|uniref:aminotransferase class III-fold pyridoxal phosphate-dependent enzyme n=1 Tax=Thalassobaculum sp. TaxID=2022740 RepID=UPI0032EAABE8
MTEPVMRNSLDPALRERAARVIPGGMWGHQKATQMPEGYPQFFARGEGPRVWDVDGNEYVDFMCSWGPIILGHRNPTVERAVDAQRAVGDCLDGPSEHLVDLAELMVRTIPHADWAMFQKNGSDATTSCVTMARAATGRRKVLVARGSYHGAVPWCSPSLAGVTAEDRAHVLHYDYNDVDSLAAAVRGAGDDLAAVLVTAFRHDIARDLEMPTRHFAQTMRALCDDAGAALILDDVRAGFRLHLGGSWETLGVRPDLAAWSKAIANGYALAAVTGGDRFREAAQKVFVTGSFWCSAVSMVAAKATIAELHAIDAPAYLERVGNRLRDGLAAQSRAHGVAIRQSGPAQMPLVLFEDDPEFTKGALFCRQALARGTYLHHRHNMFLSTAHSDADIDRALAATDAAFAAVAAAGG